MVGLQACESLGFGNLLQFVLGAFFNIVTETTKSV